MTDPHRPGVFGGWMRSWPPGRRCRRCGAVLGRAGGRPVTPRAYCGEVCAVLALMERASQTAWTQAVVEMEAGPRDLRRRLRLAHARFRAARARRRLDRHLEAAPRARREPRLWAMVVSPGRRPQWALAGLLVVLAAWGAARGRVPQTGAMAPAPAPPAVLASLPAPPPEPAPPAVPPAPPPPRPATGEDFTRGSLSIPQIALTFDGHDGANVAGEILDILQARGVRATMFLGGEFVRLFPDVVRRMVADGHEIANHLDRHPHLTSYARNQRQQTLPRVTREFLTAELRRAAASFRALMGRPMASYWRAPYGEHNAEIRAWAEEAGYRHVGWTRGAGTAEDLDTRDWVADTSSHRYRSREEIATRILEFEGGGPGALNGGIILMHLNTQRRTDRPHEALPQLLRRLQVQGYRFVTVSQLLAQAGERPADTAPSVAQAPVRQPARPLALSAPFPASRARGAW